MSNLILKVLFLYLASGFFIAKSEMHQLLILPEADPFTPFNTREYVKHPYGIGDDGILYFDYGDRYRGLGKYKNVTFIAAYANALYRDFLAGDESAKIRFLKQVDYIVKSAKYDEHGNASWPYVFDNTVFAAPQGWSSGMTNGRVLGVLVRAHAITANKSYLDFASKVFDKLRMPMIQGGLSTYSDDVVWIEEVAHRDIESTKVLNGHIFGLAGLYEYAQYTKRPQAIKYADMAIKAVESTLDNFDSGFLSYYSESSAREHRYFAEKGGYHVIHIQQLLWLYDISGNPIFLNKALVFNGYEQFEPVITSSFSTNNTSHGPEKMNLTFGNNYWSSYKFPVIVDFDLVKKRILEGITILGHTTKSTPKDFLVEVFDGEKWLGVARRKDNTLPRCHIDFTWRVSATKVRLTIFSDNGNKSVALDGVGFHQHQPEMPILNYTNFTSSISKLFDSDVHTGVLIKRNGWLLVPLSGSAIKTINIYADIVEKQNIQLYACEDLESCKPIEFSILDDRVFTSVSQVRFIKMVFSKESIKKLNEVSGF